MSGPVTSHARATVSLGLGSAVSGLLAYVVFAMITRGLGSTAAAPVSVLWTHWAFAGAAFTFPLQHWVTRTVVAEGEGAVRRAAPRLVLAVGVSAAVLGALSWLVRGELFHRDGPAFPSMIALLTVGSALIGVVRGGLGAEGRFGALAWSLVAENGLRCLLVGGLLLAGVREPAAHGACLVAGQLVVVLWPSALRFARTGAEPVGATRPFAFLTGAGSAQLMAQAVLTGGPVLLALSGGSAREVTVLFAALALFRAPYMLALGSVPQLTWRVARLGRGAPGALSVLVARLAAVAGVVVVLAGVLGALAGPVLVRLVFGSGVVVSWAYAAAVAVGCAVAVANLVWAVLALARDRPAQVLRAWVLATALAAVGFAASAHLEPVARTVATFLVAEGAAFVALLVVSARLDRAGRRQSLTRGDRDD